MALQDKNVAFNSDGIVPIFLPSVKKLIQVFSLFLKEESCAKQSAGFRGKWRAMLYEAFSRPGVNYTEGMIMKMIGLQIVLIDNCADWSPITTKTAQTQLKIRILA